MLHTAFTSWLYILPWNTKHRCLDFDLLFFHLWALFWEKTLKNKRAPQVIRACNKTRTITREFTYMILSCMDPHTTPSRSVIRKYASIFSCDAYS